MYREQHYGDYFDDDPMPFGKHKGKRLDQVPVRYLHYLWTSKLQYETGCGGVADYILKNINKLEEKDESLEW